MGNTATPACLHVVYDWVSHVCVSCERTRRDEQGEGFRMVVWEGSTEKVTF